MSKKSNKSLVCESCGRDGVGCMSPNWKPPAVSLKAQLKEANAALLEEQAFRAAIQSGWDKDMGMWQGRVQKLVAEHTETVTSMGRDLTYFKEQNKELTKRLDYETRRAAQALGVADNAAIGTACIARITNRLSCIADTLETRIEQSNTALGKLLKTSAERSPRE